MFKKRKGKKIFKLKGKYILNKENSSGFISFSDITHPAVFKRNEPLKGLSDLEYVKLDSIIQLSTISDEDIKNYDIEGKLEPGLLFFNIPEKKNIIISNDLEVLHKNRQLDKEIKYFLIKDGELYFSNDIETYLHTNTEFKY